MPCDASQGMLPTWRCVRFFFFALPNRRVARGNSFCHRRPRKKGKERFADGERRSPRRDAEIFELGLAHWFTFMCEKQLSCFSEYFGCIWQEEGEHWQHPLHLQEETRRCQHQLHLQLALIAVNQPVVLPEFELCQVLIMYEISTRISLQSSTDSSSKGSASGQAR